MKSQIVFSLILTIAIQLVSAYPSVDDTVEAFYPTLPCPLCVNQYEPICAKSTATGELKSFDNSCIMTAADCGRTEHREFSILL